MAIPHFLFSSIKDGNFEKYRSQFCVYAGISIHDMSLCCQRVI